MGHPTTLTVDDCRMAVADCFRPGTGFRVGLELELFTALPDGGRPPIELLESVVSSLDPPCGGRLSLEPGGAVELSTRPGTSVGEVCRAARDGLAVVVTELGERGILTAIGAIDTDRPPRRLVTHPRYRYMEAQFDAYSPAGRWMMNNTASLQVNISNCSLDPLAQWSALWRAAPVLTAMFADSPGVDTDGQRWASLRQGCWLALDPARTGPVAPSEGVDGYADFALGAPVLVVADDGRGDVGESWRPAPTRLSFVDWIRDPSTIGWPPTADDFAYHLSTLFPDIRPRGWMEVRCIDMGDLDHLEAVVAMVEAVGSPPLAAYIDEHIPVLSPIRAARAGLDDPDIWAATKNLVRLALAVAPVLPGGSGDHLRRFVERYTAQQRSPGWGRGLAPQSFTPDFKRRSESVSSRSLKLTDPEALPTAVDQRSQTRP